MSAYRLEQAQDAHREMRPWRPRSRSPPARIIGPRWVDEPSRVAKSAITYTYDPLDLASSQFRVFTLLPSVDDSSPLCGALRIESFIHGQYEQHSYEAVSYVWGCQDATSVLSICGAKLLISPVLAQALVHIRHVTEPRDLWVDALCIDQSNSLEKNHQVRQMYEIFSSALRVLIWLGEEDDESEFALTHLEGLKLAKRQDIPRVASIFKRPWWNRMWTFQEGLAANSNSLMLCGSRTVAWQTVLQALKDLHSSARRYADPSLHRLRYFLEVHALHRTSQRVTLERLVFASSDREASNPRDYLYALLGLVNDPSYEEIRPDYIKSSSWAFQQGMITMIKSRQDLDLLVAKLLLECPRDVPRYAVSWPSWCADFSKSHVFQHMNATYLQKRFSIMKDGASTGRHLQTVSHDAEKGTLTLSGTIVGTVAETMVIDESMGTPGRVGSQSPKGLVVLSKFEVPNNIAFIEKLRVLTDFASAEWAKLPNQKTRAKIAAGDVWKIVANGRHIEYVLDETPLSNDIYRVLPVIEKLDWDRLRELAENHSMGLELGRRTDFPPNREQQLQRITNIKSELAMNHFSGMRFLDNLEKQAKRDIVNDKGEHLGVYLRNMEDLIDTVTKIRSKLEHDTRTEAKGIDGVLEHIRRDLTQSGLIKNKHSPKLKDQLAHHWGPRQKNKFIADVAASVDWKHYPGITFTDADFENAWNAISCLDSRWVQDMCFFTTHEGYIGSGSYAIQRDDIVCILFGCKIPVVMRRGSSGIYKVVDAVYVDGMMGGEFLSDIAGYTVIDFEIN